MNNGFRMLEFYRKALEPSKAVDELENAKVLEKQYRELKLLPLIPPLPIIIFFRFLSTFPFYGCNISIIMFKDK